VDAGGKPIRGVSCRVNQTTARRRTTSDAGGNLDAEYTLSECDQDIIEIRHANYVTRTEPLLAVAGRTHWMGKVVLRDGGSAEGKLPLPGGANAALFLIPYDQLYKDKRREAPNHDYQLPDRSQADGSLRLDGLAPGATD